ncbi:MAG: DUF4878 domain-containing protein [Gammaproteobacteria bacterium]|nr:MAG: DUF4878 domain-containing protein [Gammaproteobacteria bacterium]
MKNKILIVFAILLGATLLTGCSAGPGKTVQRFFVAIDKGEIEEAIGYLSSSTIQSLGYDKWRAALIEASNQMAAEGGLKSVKVVEETVKGDIAQVTVKIVMGNGSEESDSVDLIKEDGDWKIRIDPWSK